MTRTRTGNLAFLMLLLLGCTTTPRTVPVVLASIEDAESPRPVPALPTQLRIFGATLRPRDYGFDIIDTPASRHAFVQILRLADRRMSVCAANLANAQTTRDFEGRLAPYRRQIVALSADGRVTVTRDPAPFGLRWDPSSPEAGADGYVMLPNVDETTEYVEDLAAWRDYTAATELLRRLIPRAFVYPLPPAEPNVVQGNEARSSLSRGAAAESGQGRGSVVDVPTTRRAAPWGFKSQAGRLCYSRIGATGRGLSRDLCWHAYAFGRTISNTPVTSA